MKLPSSVVQLTVERRYNAYAKLQLLDTVNDGSYVEIIYCEVGGAHVFADHIPIRECGQFIARSEWRRLSKDGALGGLSKQDVVISWYHSSWGVSYISLSRSALIQHGIRGRISEWHRLTESHWVVRYWFCYHSRSTPFSQVMAVREKWEKKSWGTVYVTYGTLLVMRRRSEPLERQFRTLSLSGCVIMSYYSKSCARAASPATTFHSV